MSEEIEIIEEPEFNAEEIIEYGEKIAESVYKDVYRKDDDILKVVKGDCQTDEMKRLGTFLPGKSGAFHICTDRRSFRY